jgi:hypothetical protein
MGSILAWFSRFARKIRFQQERVTKTSLPTLTFLLTLAVWLPSLQRVMLPEERSRRPVTRRVALLLIVVAALLAFALLKPGTRVRVGMSEEEVERVLGGAHRMLPQGRCSMAPYAAKTKVWVLGKTRVYVDFDENGRAIAVNDDSETPWARFRKWLGLAP